MNQEIISSSKNPHLKQLKKLMSSAKFRSQEGLAVAEGIHLAKSIDLVDAKAKQLFCAESALRNPEVSQLVEQFGLKGVQPIVVKNSLFESISQIHASVGILLVFSPGIVAPQSSLRVDALLLENVQDPGNLGTILRTAAAAGVSQVYLSSGSASAFSPKALRAGMGAQFSLEIYENVDLIKLAETSDVALIATDLNSQTGLYQADLTRQTAWVFGSEGSGVSPELLAACQATVIVPQAKSAVESLNVSAAVAVCLFEQRRQRELGSRSL